MLELLISIMMTLGIQFTKTNDGRLGVSSNDMSTLQSSELYQKSGINSNDDVVIVTGVDPVLESDSNE